MVLIDLQELDHHRRTANDRGGGRSKQCTRAKYSGTLDGVECGIARRRCIAERWRDQHIVYHVNNAVAGGNVGGNNGGNVQLDWTQRRNGQTVFDLHPIRQCRRRDRAPDDDCCTIHVPLVCFIIVSMSHNAHVKTYRETTGLRATSERWRGWSVYLRELRVVC
jgi:hypothetical protein